MEENLIKWFKSEDIDIKPTWIRSVIAQHDRFQSLSEADQRKHAYNAWLTANLTHTTSGTLKPVVGTLTTCLIVQVLKYSDIAKPAYAQLRRHNENDDFDEEPESGSNYKVPTKRTIELIVTDGVNTMRAFEVEPWSSSLPLPLMAGTKLRLMPPIVTEQMVLFLSDENIRLLGGGEKTDQSIEIAHLESRIIAAGGEPPERGNKEKSSLDSICHVKPKKRPLAAPVKAPAPVPKQPTGQARMTSFFKPKEPKVETKMQVDDDDEWSDDEAFEEVASTQVKPATVVDEEPWPDDDDLFSQIQATTTSTNSAQNNDDNEWDDDIEEPHVISDSSQETIKAEAANAKKPKVDFLINLSGSNRLTVRACIVKVVRKISIKSNLGITVDVLITDGTADLTVTIAHEAMEQLFECDFPKSQVAKMKKQLRERNERVQRNMHDYFGLVELLKEGSRWTVTRFCQL